MTVAGHGVGQWACQRREPAGPPPPVVPGAIPGALPGAGCPGVFAVWPCKLPVVVAKMQIPGSTSVTVNGTLSS